MRPILAAAALLSACTAPQPAPAGPAYAPPEPVAIVGYDGDAMEPFLSRDGATLFFNNRNDPAEQTDLHWATRIDDLHFRYRGKLDGANSPDLDGVPTLSADKRLCFISPRSYAATLASVHCGLWADGGASNVVLQRKAAPLIPGRVVFDIELAADGQTAIIADGQFKGGPAPASADLRLARLVNGELQLDPASDPLFAAVNTSGLEYAAALSADGLDLAFTRLTGRPPFASTAIWTAHRTAPDQPLGPPARIRAIDGFVEAPTFAPGGAIYFHKRDGDRFTLWRAAPG